MMEMTNSSALDLQNSWYVVENEYNLATEPNVATLLTTGNGYIGVRGSLEEYGSLRIQGCYIRGLIDRIYELVQPFTDNMYMKKYYIDEDKLKHFEKQDSIINYADFLLVRVTIDGETFYPWEGNLLSWKRYLDMENSCLVREVRWENSKGDITGIKFQRFSSFDDDHVYGIKVSVTPENHKKDIEILTGIDLRTKTNGQRITKTLSTRCDKHRLYYANMAGEKYGFVYYTGVCHTFTASDNAPAAWGCVDDGDFLANTIQFSSAQGQTYTLEKKIYVITSRDTDEDLETVVTRQIELLDTLTYDALFERHANRWKEIFRHLDIRIEGDDDADMAVRFSNYHTAISFARNDSVHSLSAKGLTGETYNNFVWWDCEVYQAPVFFYTVPHMAKNIILYRYGKLDAARENARKEGRKGARFPFTSSVTGEETVWEYARHPFMQVHIVSDVAWSVINYFLCTNDLDFLMRYGLEILWEVARYWSTRVEYDAALNRYVIKTVTGTDEHHPYVDNNAYTNYSVRCVLSHAVKFYDRLGSETAALRAKIHLSSEEVGEWREISDRLYLPMDEATGMIPQFDGYFNLSRNLEVQGGSAAKSFQMKQSGLYNNSQVIKQPDVMLLFSYLNFPFNDTVYRRNWDYYEARCESSSSLSYPVHAICAADMEQPESAYQYLLKTARLDLDDDHNCAWQGLHSACAAGAWFATVRGIGGIVYREDVIEVNPHMIPWWKQVSFSVVWHGQTLHICLTNQQITITAADANTLPVPLSFKGSTKSVSAGQCAVFDVAADTRFTMNC